MLPLFLSVPLCSSCDNLPSYGHLAPMCESTEPSILHAMLFSGISNQLLFRLMIFGIWGFVLFFFLTFQIFLFLPNNKIFFKEKCCKAFKQGAPLVAQMVKRLSTMWETRVQSLGREDPLEKEMAIHSSTIAWKIPWTVAYQAPLSMGFSRQ